MKNLVSILLGMMLIASAQAVTINVTCDYPSITNALLTTAQEGDTVLIGAGDCIISNAIVVSRGISFTIAGSGSNLTTLRSSPSGTALWPMNNSTNTFTIRDINFVGGNNDSGGTIICGWTAYDSPGFYHIYNIQMTNVAYRGISVGHGKSHGAFGLVDHCYLRSTNFNPQFMDFEGANENSWTNANPLGTTNVVCVEDNIFDNGTNAGNGFFDAYDGAQFVFRHNVCIGYSTAGGHGYDSDISGPRTWEVYNNIFTNSPTSPPSTSILAFRGGTGLVFSNAAYNVGGGFMSLLLYRACPADNVNVIGGQPYCDGNIYLGEGVPGFPYIVNFTSNCPTAGQGIVLTNNPTNTQTLFLGATRYTFVSTLANATTGMVDFGGYGGGAVLIGASTAATITNFYRAVNADQAYYGISFTNASEYGVPYRTGHEFIATNLDATSLYLKNALDGTNAFGYPGNEQLGVLTSYPLTGTNFVNNQVVFPIYQWSNTFNGSVVSLPAAYSDSCGDYKTNLFKIGRDYSNAMPSTLTYTPLVYPHPLNSGGGGGGSTSQGTRASARF